MARDGLRGNLPARDDFTPPRREPAWRLAVVLRAALAFLAVAFLAVFLPGVRLAGRFAAAGLVVVFFLAEAFRPLVAGALVRLAGDFRSVFFVVRFLAAFFATAFFLAIVFLAALRGAFLAVAFADDALLAAVFFAIFLRFAGDLVFLVLAVAFIVPILPSERSYRTYRLIVAIRPEAIACCSFV